MSETDLFLEYLQKKDLSPDTINHYRIALTNFWEWFTKTTQQPNSAARVTPLDLRQYRNHLKTKYKAGTVNNKLSYLTTFFRWCHTNNYISSDPTANLKRSQIAPKAPKWLTRQETFTILRMAEQQLQIARLHQLKASEQIAARTLALVLLMLNAGLRASEAANLKISDIEINQRKGKVVVRYGKGSKEREIPLNSDARKGIETWLKTRNTDSQYLFPGPDNQSPINRLLISWHIRQLGKKAGVHLHPHRLRHTFGKNLIDTGVSLDRVSILMGHSNPGTTAIYTVPDANDLQNDVEKIAWSD